ncbi:MAG: aspartate/glutamate racemase family protein [Proteobacteria bacterium]|nr:aspartate/glutamate racemase family protein [Pseudomonadota bacterium]
MKTIGLLGGMSWESTVTYYQTINALVKQQLGGFHSAKILLYSVNFDPIEKLQHKGDWAGTAEILTKAAMNLENGGADFLLICTNTMHRVAPQIQESLTIPILHIADATAEELKKSKINKVGLLGTAFTMEHDFYKGRLREKHGLKVITPDQEDRTLVHDVIYNELCMGKFNENSKNAYMQVIEKLKESGAEAVILGCTEIALLVGKEKTSIPMFDTAKIHAQKSVELALD